MVSAFKDNPSGIDLSNYALGVFDLCCFEPAAEQILQLIFGQGLPACTFCSTLQGLPYEN